MATYLLDGTQSARLPRRPLAVTMTVGGPNRSGARLTARLASGGEAAVVVHSPGMLIVPRVDEEIIISALPDAGRVEFDDQTTLYVSIGPDTDKDPDADNARLAPRDVSGLASIELASISAAGPDQVAIATRLVVADVPLSPLANRARVACRGALQVDALGAQDQISVGVVVDCSSSMAPLVDDGTVTTAADIVVGVAAVVAGSQPVVTVLADGAGTRLPDGPLGELSTRVTHGISVSGFGIGANLDAAVAQFAGNAGFIVVITDQVLTAVPAGAKEPLNVLVVSADSRAGGHRWAALPAPPAGAEATAFYTSNPYLIDDAVTALVAPLRAGRFG